MWRFLSLVQVALDRHYFLSLLFSWEKIVVITAVALVFSLFPTSTASAITFTFFFWIMGHFSSEILFVSRKITQPVLAAVCKLLYFVFPNFQIMNIRDLPADFYNVQWLWAARRLWAFYTGVCLSLTAILFRKKEFLVPHSPRPNWLLSFTLIMSVSLASLAAHQFTNPFPPLSVSLSSPIAQLSDFAGLAMGFRKLTADIAWIQTLIYYGTREEGQTEEEEHSGGGQYPLFLAYCLRVARIDPNFKYVFYWWRWSPGLESQSVGRGFRGALLKGRYLRSSQ